MRRLAITTSIAAALVLASAALAAGTLAGKYTTRIASTGTWVLNFATGGTYTVSDNGRIVVRGKYSTTGSKVTLSHETGPAACSTSGKYSWTRTGKTLRFVRISDSKCAGRSGVLSHAFTQIG
ncbi:MAG TPA: hypothetical protein VKR23_13890 [Gaiellaceae bacterium]|nr:hypothetical protein [Gaiellaceae bacterium]